LSQRKTTEVNLITLLTVRLNGTNAELITAFIKLLQ